MPRRPEIGNVQLYPNRSLNDSDKNGYVLKFYCPIHQKRIRKNCGTRDRREARRIQRECRERLVNGSYLDSNGAIIEAHESVRDAVRSVLANSSGEGDGADRTWEECLEAYKQKHKRKTRSTSHNDTASRLDIAQRILQARREDAGLLPEGPVNEFMTLESLEYVQDRLLEGDEGRYDYRAASTVNSMMGAVMGFVRFCAKRGWISAVPPIEELSVDEVMKGRPVTIDEFERMIDATEQVVGRRSRDSWQRVLYVLWESAFRIGDVMNFSWDDTKRIHPIWPTQKDRLPTLAIPSSQKNRKVQEIPMLPGLQQLLEKTSNRDRHGWVVNPEPIEFTIRSKSDWFQPTTTDLAALVNHHSNSAIARCCRVTETTVRKWLQAAEIARPAEFDRYAGDINDDEAAKLRKRSERSRSHTAQRRGRRLTKERVSRIISEIGEAADIVVQQPDKESGRRRKYASAHDLRRGCAQRLINAGVSAETLKVVMRHKDFRTTERFYGATRAAQSAAREINEKMAAALTQIELVGGLVGGQNKPPQLSAEEVHKLKSLLDSL